MSSLPIKEENTTFKTYDRVSKMYWSDPKKNSAGNIGPNQSTFHNSNESNRSEQIG